MAGGAGRRNILRELSALDQAGTSVSNSSFPLTPPSPEESIIQLRGHQRKSATYRYNAPDPVFFKTPPKSPKNNTLLKSSTPTRSSPRKRLNLTPDTSISNEAGGSGLNSNNRMKGINFSHMKLPVDISKNIKALSHAQLVQLINDAVQKTSALEETLVSLLPEPDLIPVQERLRVLQKNVLKTYPRNMWGDQDSSFCFLRIRAHLEAFKKECLDFCRQFMESQHWPSVFEYILFAWKLTLGLPSWSSPTHNKVKSSCIRYLSSQFVFAIKKSNIDEINLNEIVQSLEQLGDHCEVQTCVRHVKDKMNCD